MQLFIKTHGQNFPEKVGLLIQELSNILDIEIDKLDKSEDSINLLDIFFIKNKGIIDEDFLDENIMRVEAYLGEVFIKTYGGHWEVKYYPEYDAYIPYIRINGFSISFYIDIMKGFIEEGVFDIAWTYQFNIPREIRK